MAKNTETTKKRKLKKGTYKSFKLHKKIRHTGVPLPSSSSILKQSFQLMWQNKVVFGGVLLVYALLQILLVQGVLTSNFSDLRSVFEDSFGGLGGSLATLSYMVTNIGQASSAEAGVYQSILYLIASLAIIWTIRQLSSSARIRIRDAYYKGMYPLIPYFLVMLVIAIQLIPALIGAWLFSIVMANGMAVSIVEQAFWFAVFGIFALASIYMICSSVFALFVVSLPDVAPMRALRSAREFVRYRRLSIVGRVTVLLLCIAVVFTVVMVPIIMFAPVLAPFVFYIATVLVIGFSITYMYNIYRGLIEHDD